jgi:hypothetical protein
MIKRYLLATASLVPLCFAACSGAEPQEDPTAASAVPEALGTTGQCTPPPGQPVISCNDVVNQVLGAIGNLQKHDQWSCQNDRPGTGLPNRLWTAENKVLSCIQTPGAFPVWEFVEATSVGFFTAAAEVKILGAVNPICLAFEGAVDLWILNENWKTEQLNTCTECTKFLNNEINDCGLALGYAEQACRGVTQLVQKQVPQCIPYFPNRQLPDCGSGTFAQWASDCSAIDKDAIAFTAQCSNVNGSGSACKAAGQTCSRDAYGVNNCCGGSHENGPLVDHCGNTMPNKAGCFLSYGGASYRCASSGL